MQTGFVPIDVQSNAYTYKAGFYIEDKVYSKYRMMSRKILENVPHITLSVFLRMGI